ncbi:MAG: DUF2202 domain-containing protein [Gammaproteobacteria bacterium]|nr:DUF2202 domain-containing protein [Gammaproteobacteria bacterium]
MKNQFGKIMNPAMGNRASEASAKAFAGGGRGQDKAAQPLELSPAETDSLLFMIEEEKLAGDLYQAFYAQTGLEIFGRIAQSEDRHYNALIRQAERADLNLEALQALGEGEFVNTDLQLLYNQMLAEGSISAEAALAVGQAIEQADIADLQGSLESLQSPALIGVYSRLLAGSENHLSAFDSWLVA